MQSQVRRQRCGTVITKEEKGRERQLKRGKMEHLGFVRDSKPFKVLLPASYQAIHPYEAHDNENRNSYLGNKTIIVIYFSFHISTSTSFSSTTALLHFPLSKIDSVSPSFLLHALPSFRLLYHAHVLLLHPQILLPLHQIEAVLFAALNVVFICMKTCVIEPPSYGGSFFDIARAWYFYGKDIISSQYLNDG